MGNQLRRAGLPERPIPQAAPCRPRPAASSRPVCCGRERHLLPLHRGWPRQASVMGQFRILIRAGWHVVCPTERHAYPA